MVQKDACRHAETPFCIVDLVDLRHYGELSIEQSKIQHMMRELANWLFRR